ncbi:DNA-3-methyladenine glycosylase family protein [Priestia endophytica]|uniref:DNA-3-methyladenine glycosylase family protein n=1 Tax=Priestia endophytica TaxID=135735 RepID=UPI0022811CDF|nr:DNA-3-methyladenine glycosylase 2 family protein [Priestia endophytica]MCY8233886.1 DNA-3-methyladenine glycosylase 2 family protein [Priestia endophytica]
MQEKLDILSQSDPVLGRFIEIIGPLKLKKQNDLYLSLVKSIIGQQLSVKAADTIFGRFVVLTNSLVSPEIVLMLSDEELRGIGISYQKIRYIKDLSQKVFEKEIELETLNALNNDEVISTLTKVKGIGTWTAEMFLIFSLGRENVLSLADVGLQRGVKWLYNADDGKKALIEKGAYWNPYRSLASLYLWEAVNLGFVMKYKSFNEYLL